MKEQNFKSHSRYVVGYHFVTLTAILILLIGSFVNLFNSARENLYSASLICMIALILGSLAWFLRAFALKAQDRAIRAEENLRHFILTGKALPPTLRMGQVIALRFAPDEEFIELATTAAAEKLSPKEIKRAIKNWKADHYRA